MILAAILIVLLLQLLVGLGILQQLRFRGRFLPVLGLGILLGLPISAIGVLLLDLLGVRLTLPMVLFALALLALLANGGSIRNPRRILEPMGQRGRSLQLQEAPFLVVLLLLVAISVERCWHLPISLRDMMVGPDLVAKYAVEQGRICSSVFSDPHLQGHLSNQPFYAPFTTLMQIIFRLTGHPFGQVWIAAVFVGFLMFLYGGLREMLHPLLAGLLSVLFVAVPELFAHTFMVTVDFSNAIFFGVSVVLLAEWLETGRLGTLVLSALFMGFACLSRAETILFVPVGMILVLLGFRSARLALRLRRAALFALPPLLLFLLWQVVYLGFRLPAPAPETWIDWHPHSLRGLLSLAVAIAGLLGYPTVYGYLPYGFAAGVAANLWLLQDRRRLALLLWVPILYLGLVVIVALFPAAGVETTAKRGWLKLFPIMVCYLGGSGLLRRLSEKLERWERGPRAMEEGLCRAAH